MTMKLNKSKGKVHPSPSSSSSSSFSLSSTSSDPVSSLNLLLPAAILTLISVLSPQDREVLAYMITRSLKSSSSSLLDDKRKQQPKNSKSAPTHKSPSFDCECFDCYTTYWFRWDSSPHRELIHQAIEAFEEHLASTEQPKRKTLTKPRRREKEKEKDKSYRRGNPTTPVLADAAAPEQPEERVVEAEQVDENRSMNVQSPENGKATVLENSEALPESMATGAEATTQTEERENGEEEEVSGGKKKKEEQQPIQQQQHKGLARKVLPDVIGLFNSRLWNLWGPNV